MHKSHRVAPARLFVPGSQSDELSYTFVEILSSGDGCRAIFGTFQVRSTSDLYHNVIGQIVKNFKGFFETNHRVDLDKANPGELLFENALQYTNSQVTHHLREVAEREGKASFDARRFSLVLGLIWDNSLHLCSAGKQVKAFYLYPSKRENTISHYALVDILEGSDESVESADIASLFSQVISGSVAIPESTLIVCNQSFLDYISPDQIKQAVTSYSNERLNPHFQNLLGKVNTRADFSALFLKCTQHEIEAPAVAMRPQTVSHESVQELISTEKGTETILSPALGSHIKDIVTRTTQAAILTPLGLLRTQVARVDFERIKDVLSKSSTLRDTATKTGSALWHTSRIKLHQLRKKDRKVVTQEIADEMLGWIKEKAVLGKEKFITLPNTSKALLVASCLLLGVFVISVFSLQVQKQDKQATKEYDTMVQAVQQKTNLADASLIYDDEIKARSLLGEAEAALALLPQKTGPQLELHKTLQQQIEVTRRKIAKIFVVTPKNLVSLDTQIPTLESLRLIGEGGSYAVASRDGVYTLDLEKGKALQINTQAKIPEVRCAAPLSATVFYVCAADGKLFSVNTKDQSVNATPITLSDGESMDIITTYNNRLYVLDALKGTLTRHNKSGTGFGSGTTPAGFTKEQLIGATTLAIDGAIMILDSKGVLQKVASGKAAPIPYPSMEPTFERATKLWTSVESSYYYLLDPTNKRIVVLDKKTNKLKGQLTADQFSNLADIVVNEKKKEALVLAGTAVLSVPLDFFDQK